MSISLLLFLLYFLSMFSFLFVHGLTNEPDKNIGIVAFQSLLCSIAAPFIALFIIARHLYFISTKGNYNA